VGPQQQATVRHTGMAVCRLAWARAGVGCQGRSRPRGVTSGFRTSRWCGLRAVRAAGRLATLSRGQDEAAVGTAVVEPTKHEGAPADDPALVVVVVVGVDEDVLVGERRRDE